MTRKGKRFTAAGVLAIASAGLAFAPSARGQCASPKTNAPVLIANYQCGGTNWQLSYQFNGTTYQSGTYSPNGTCGGNIYQCNCSYQQYFQYSGYLTGQVITESSGVWSLFWDSTEYYNAVKAGCPSGSCCPANAVFQLPNPPTYSKNYLYEVTLSCP